MALIEVTISWPIIYFVMMLPALLMAANFVFGSCTVSDFVDQMSGKVEAEGALTPSQKKDMLSRRRKGKLVLAFMFGLFVVEPFTYLGFVRNGQCSIGGYLFFGRTISQCGWLETVYLVTWAAKVSLFLANVLSNPGLKRSDQNTNAHRCRTCNVVVPGHDHHCIFINNCVGSTNYHLFLIFLLVSVINTHLIFCTTVGDIFQRGNVVEMALALVVYVFFFGLLGLLTFHVLLLRKGVTTSQFLRNYRDTRKRILFLLL